MPLIYIISALPGYFLSMVYLLIKNENRKSNILFSLFLFSISTILLSYYWDYINFYISYPEFLLLKDYLYLLSFPLFYFSVVASVNKEFKFEIIHLLNLLPFVIFTLFTVSFYLSGHDFMVDAVITIKNYKTSGVYGIQDILLSQVLNSIAIIYLILSYRQIKKYYQTTNTKLKNKESHIKAGTEKIILGLLTIILIEAFIDLFHRYYYNEFVTPFLFTLFFYGVIFLGLKQSGFLGVSKFKKYKFFNLTPEKSYEVVKNLLFLMEKEKVYLDSSLSLPQLAKELKMPPYQLSQIINEQFEQNFFNFVNKFRIEESKRKLTNNLNKSENISEIAFSVGFNSLSAFNSAFKKFTNCSPSEFKKQVQNNRFL